MRFLVAKNFLMMRGFCFVWQGLTTLRLVRPKSSRPLSPRVVMGVLSDIWQMAADRVGKIRVIEDPKVCIFPFLLFQGLLFSKSYILRGFSSD